MQRDTGASKVTIMSGLDTQYGRQQRRQESREDAIQAWQRDLEGTPLNTSTRQGRLATQGEGGCDAKRKVEIEKPYIQETLQVETWQGPDREKL